MADWVRRLVMAISRWHDERAAQERDDRADARIRRAIETRQAVERSTGLSFSDRLERTGKAYRRVHLRHR